MNYNKNRVFAILCETMQIVVKLLRFHVVSDRNNFWIIGATACVGFYFYFLGTFNLYYDKKSLLTLLVE